MKLKDVFVAGGIPKLTYIPRTHLQLESRLKNGLDEGHQIIALTGPTKTGKTVLCRTVLKGRETLWIDAGQIESVEEFWGLGAEKLSIPQEVAQTSGKGLKAGVNYVVVVEGEYSGQIEKRYYPSAKAAVLGHCKKNGICIVVDDFHYLTDQDQKSIIRALKSEIFDGLEAIFIAVPHRAFDTIQNEREMEGRFIHIEIPAWETDELRSIAEKGFPALNVEFRAEDAEEFARESFGSPILMQRFCLRICSEYNIDETLASKRNIRPSDDKKMEIYAAVAQSYGFPTFKILAEGPQSRTDRLPRKLKGSDDEVDIYSALLRAIAQTGPEAVLPYDDIRDAMRQTVEDKSMPQKQQITNSLSYMSREARSKIKGEPPLEWRDETLYLTDPSLMFYLRWAFR